MYNLDAESSLLLTELKSVYSELLSREGKAGKALAFSV